MSNCGQCPSVCLDTEKCDSFVTVPQPGFEQDYQKTKDVL
jgi:hypothetical protein